MYQLTDYLDSITANPSFNGRNLLINAGFWVNQRSYTSSTVTTSANQFTLDRWFIPASGQSMSFADYEGTRTVTAPASGICQVIEGAHLQTGTYTLSWQGSATGYVNDIAFENGSSMNITGGANITIKFENGTVSNPQFELGSTATQFENRFYASELFLCQRYYIRLQDLASQSHNIYGCGFAYSIGSVALVFNLPATMRTSPSITYSAITDWTLVGTGYTLPVVTNFCPPDLEVNSIRMVVGSTGLTIGGIYTLQSNNTTAAWLAFDAELTI